MSRSGCICIMAIFLIAAGIFIGIGFDKMYSYEPSEYADGGAKNVYVGGDAYNLIINGTYSTAFFVLGGACIVSALLVLIAYYAAALLKENQANNCEEKPVLHEIESSNCEYSSSAQEG